LTSSFSKTLQTRAAVLAPKLQAWLKNQAGESLDRLERQLVVFVAPMALAYLFAIVVGGMMSNSMVSNMIASRSRISARDSDGAAVILERPAMANVRDLQKQIKERNLFNSEGKFPEEKAAGAGGGSLARFDMNAPCINTSLPIELLGTIFLGDPTKSLATVRDKTYSEADIYRVGDTIYGNETALVAAVERQKLIINNNGVKECIDLDKGVPGVGNDGFPGGVSGDFGTLPMSGAGGGSEITVEASYVEGELGPGFGKIVDAARLVPNTVDGGINGFKIFAIKGGTLFARVGLQNGDVITQVNDTNMRQPEQGFALYQAFQDEKVVRIQFLRGGVTPQNITVQIK
jgi:general secretion pathway protein C